MQPRNCWKLLSEDRMQSPPPRNGDDVHQPATFGHWSSPLFGCMENPGSCFLAWCCPCFSLGRTMHRMGLKRYSDVVLTMFLIFVLRNVLWGVRGIVATEVVSVCLSLLLGLYIYTNREHLRRKLGIPYEPCDPVVSVFCSCCVLAQMANQVGLNDCEFAPPPVMADQVSMPSGTGLGPGGVVVPERYPNQPQPVMMVPMGPGGCVHPGLGAAAAANGGILPPFCPNCGMTTSEPQQVVGPQHPQQLAVAQPVDVVPVALPPSSSDDYVVPMGVPVAAVVTSTTQDEYDHVNGKDSPV